MACNKHYLAFALFALTLIGAIAAPNDDIGKRKSWLLDQMRSAQPDREHPKFKTYDILGITAARGCGPSEYAKYMANVLAMDQVTADGVHIPEMFALPPLVRYLYQFGDCLSRDQKAGIGELLSRKMNLFDHGTLNHAMLRVASWYLLAQYFPKVQWHNMDGRKLSSGELMLELKLHLQQRTAKFLQAGHYEQLSPTYAMINLFPLLNLIDFAEDQSLRSSSNDEASFEVAVLQVHSFQGVIVPPLTRRNFQQRNGPSPSKTLDPSVSQHILWYYFGAPNLQINDIESRREPVYVTMLALSKWRPSEAILDLKNPKLEPYQVTTITPSFSQWGAATVGEVYGKATIDKHFAIGAGNLVFEPTGYNEDTQQFGIVLESKEVDNQIECYHPYWRGNLGEDAWSRDRSSPFMQTWLDKTQGVLIFDIPSSDPWVVPEENRFYKLRSVRKNALHQLAQCRIPANFDTVEVGENWIFIKEGKSFVALYTLAGKNELQNDTANHDLGRYIAFKVRQPRTAIYFVAEEQAAGLNFDDFKHRVMANPPKFDLSTSSVGLIDPQGKYVNIQFTLDKKPKDGRVASLPRISIDGVVQSTFSSGPVFSPILKLYGGRLWLGNTDIPGGYQ